MTFAEVDWINWITVIGVVLTWFRYRSRLYQVRLPPQKRAQWLAARGIAMCEPDCAPSTRLRYCTPISCARCPQRALDGKSGGGSG